MIRPAPKRVVEILETSSKRNQERQRYRSLSWRGRSSVRPGALGPRPSGRLLMRAGQEQFGAGMPKQAPTETG